MTRRLPHRGRIVCQGLPHSLAGFRCVDAGEAPHRPQTGRHLSLHLGKHVGHLRDSLPCCKSLHRSLSNRRPLIAQPRCELSSCRG